MKNYILLLLILVLGAGPLSAQNGEKSNEEIFMNHFKNNWDDIHDVIMRYHYEDPWLQGRALINMTWTQGRLEDAEVLENTTGNPGFGNDLIAAMKSWEIDKISGPWSSVLPIKTSIKGSEDPDFNDYGILTGKLSDKDGKAIPDAGLVLTPSERTSMKSIAIHTNREGIFIETLIFPGTYHLSCNVKGYTPVTIENIVIEKGKHCKQDISIK